MKPRKIEKGRRLIGLHLSPKQGALRNFNGAYAIYEVTYLVGNTYTNQIEKGTWIDDLPRDSENPNVGVGHPDIHFVFQAAQPLYDVLQQACVDFDESLKRPRKKKR